MQLRALTRQRCHDHQICACTLSTNDNPLKPMSCGERGIRTLGSPFGDRQFSKLVVSATHPPLRGRIFTEGIPSPENAGGIFHSETYHFVVL